MVAVQVLGAVEVLDDGRSVAIGGPRPTSILVALALAGGSVVSVDGLVTEVWGDHAPRSAVETLQSYLSRLRRVLERLAGAAGDTTSARRWLALAASRAERLDARGLVALCHARLGQQLQLDGEPEAAAAALAAAEIAVEGTDDPWVRAGLSDVAGHLAVAAGDLDRAATAFRTSERRYLAAEDRWSACLARIGRAWVARRVGDTAEALALHAENLRATRELTRSAFDFVGLARDLRGVAALAGRAGQAELAARLCGASEALRDLGEVALTSDERTEVDHALREATAAIGADGVQRAQANGRSLGAAAALDLALAATEDLAAVAVVEPAP